MNMENPQERAYSWNQFVESGFDGRDYEFPAYEGEFTGTIVVQGRKNFIASVKKDVTKLLLKEKLYTKIRNVYDEFLGELYTDIQLYR